jgi:hypothetical protein
MTSHNDDDNFPNTVEDNYNLQLALAMNMDNSEYFVKLLHPSFFIDIAMEDKISQVICIVGLTQDKEKKEKYLNHFIFDTDLDKNILENRYSLLEELGINIDEIRELFYLKEVNKMDKELGSKNNKTAKKIKV